MKLPRCAHVRLNFVTTVTISTCCGCMCSISGKKNWSNVPQHYPEWHVWIPSHSIYYRATIESDCTRIYLCMYPLLHAFHIHITCTYIYISILHIYQRVHITICSRIHISMQVYTRACLYKVEHLIQNFGISGKLIPISENVSNKSCTIWRETDN